MGESRAICSFSWSRVFVEELGQGWKEKLADHLKNLRHSWKFAIQAEIILTAHAIYEQCFDQQMENLKYTDAQPQTQGSTEVREEIAEVKLQIARRSYLNLDFYTQIEI